MMVVMVMVMVMVRVMVMVAAEEPGCAQTQRGQCQ
jgi:hypothetical protein